MRILTFSRNECNRTVKIHRKYFHWKTIKLLKFSRRKNLAHSLAGSGSGLLLIVISCVLDPDSFIPDPEPGFWWPKTGKNLQLKKKFDIFLFAKTAIYLSLGLHKVRPNYNYKRSLLPSNENIQHFKKWNFSTFFYCCGSFLPCWIRIRNTGQKQDQYQNLGKKDTTTRKKSCWFIILTVSHHSGSQRSLNSSRKNKKLLKYPKAAWRGLNGVFINWHVRHLWYIYIYSSERNF
jgi:hypothetical protein